jgi:acyl-coenzyme A synthetase/AMP-(fatty) acid ligase
VQNPLNTRYPELIYRTGDIGYRNERGEICFIGRKDFQIKHMGYRIELSEIEHRALCVEGIANACVLYNAGRKEISLFFESKGEQVTPAAIRKDLSSIFPKYMLPTAFYPLKELPRNPNGKIDRNGLLSMLRGEV